MPWAPTMPVSALMAVSDTPNKMPAAPASMTPWCSRVPPMRGPMMSSPPMPNRPASKEVMTAGEKRECAPCMAGSVIPSSTSPAAVRSRPSRLAATHLEAEHAVSHDGDEHDAGGERHLDDRHGRERERGDVQAPAGGGGDHAEREPLGGVQLAHRAQRVQDLTRWEPSLAPRYL